jgi:hypothetical protein
MTAPYSNDTTSKDAAVAVAGSAAQLREQVYDLIAANPQGLTDEEIQIKLGMKGNTQRPRRWELSETGRIIKHGTRKVKSGKQAIVWRVNEGVSVGQGSRALKLQLQVSNVADERVYNLTLDARRQGQTFRFKLPEAVTIYPDDEVTLSYSLHAATEGEQCDNG